MLLAIHSECARLAGPYLAPCSWARKRSYQPKVERSDSLALFTESVAGIPSIRWSSGPHVISVVEELVLNLHILHTHSKAVYILARVIMSAAGGTFRGTPSRGQARGQVPAFENSPSNIPRPKLESQASSTIQSDNGMSTLSASRQKQSKRDEVHRIDLDSA